MLRAGCVMNVSGFQTWRSPAWKCRENSAYSVLILWTAVLNIEVSKPVNCTDWRMNLASSGLFLRLHDHAVWQSLDNGINSPLLNRWKIFQGQDSLDTQYELLFLFTISGSYHAPSSGMGSIGNLKLSDVFLHWFKCVVWSRIHHIQERELISAFLA
jgi:hypothetical protein